MSKLLVSEIFYSLQGEGCNVGIPTTFVRLVGCPLRCAYCDTKYAYAGGSWQTLEQVVEKVAMHATVHVMVTGGEPLAQSACHALLLALLTAGYRVSIETGGSQPINAIADGIQIILDIKTPGSGVVNSNNYSNLRLLRPNDYVKFVICDHEDYIWAVQKAREFDILKPDQTLFSPAVPCLEPRVLADWMVADQLPVRFNCLLHKTLWGEARGR